MEHLKENERRNVDAEFYKTHIHLKKVFTVNHFIQMGIPRSTIYAFCTRIYKNNSVQRKPGSGRPARKLPERKGQPLVCAAHGKPDVSLRTLCWKFKIDKKYVSNILKQNNVKRSTRKSAPKYSEKQKLEQR
ncbi:hypothetical protein ILUMI_16964 [Ignelater luminosus]|uniref:Uncharacterized protein n=1 Tax=Ignelater luminosus TaxID=2038154 RepID=A0A8K0CKR0_IGNLU|nr:hypothetical protein ILUMI_16964 [Ignelater luminosus]